MSRIITKGFLSLLGPAILVRADYPPYDYSNQFAPLGDNAGNQSLTYVAPYPRKYEIWYNAWAPQLKRISESVCNLSLAAYQGNATARDTLGPVYDYCWTHSNCILQNVNPNITQSIASAAILLGLTPTILSVLGPSVAEIALLSMHRPFLSLLLSLGAPAVYPGRFLIWDDPMCVNEPQTGAWVVQPLSMRWAIVVSTTQYVLAMGAVALNIYTAWAMGVRAVLVWFCDTSYWPLLWVVLTIVTHTIAVLSLRLAIHKKRAVPLGATAREHKSLGRRLLSAFKREFTPMANSKSQVRNHFDVRLGPVHVMLQYIGALVALVHLIFGTAMFSSLLYLGAGDAISTILLFVASAVVSRVILQFEIGGMIRPDGTHLVYKGVVQPLMPKDASKEKGKGEGLEGVRDSKNVTEIAVIPSEKLVV